MASGQSARLDRFALGSFRVLVLSHDALACLTRAEREIVGLVVLGVSNREIARRRGSSVHTIGNQLASVYRKLGVSSRFELVARLHTAQ